MDRSSPSFLSGLWANRGLLWQFTTRNVELRHKGSHLGLVWAVIAPLLLLSLYVFVFGYIFGGKFGIIPNETKIDYGLGIFLGLSIFHVFAEVGGLAPTAIITQPNLVKKVVFPLEILPASIVLGALFHFGVSMSILLMGVASVGPGLTIHSLWIFAIAFPLVFFLLGTGWILSALGVFFRDITQMVPFCTMAVMFASAVFYSAQSIPTEAWVWMRLNPVLLFVEMSRDAILWGRPINLNHLAFVYAASAAIFYFGQFFFRKVQSAFADVL